MSVWQHCGWIQAIYVTRSVNNPVSILKQVLMGGKERKGELLI